ncbi:MAG: hypothetical protein GF364_16730 [Candidatus Lokiarchaeota archaeon]|nr:hypothetical protein [Candidatus Lokiarchaeota archaeon]
METVLLASDINSLLAKLDKIVLKYNSLINFEVNQGLIELRGEEYSGTSERICTEIISMERYLRRAKEPKILPFRKAVDEIREQVLKLKKAYESDPNQIDKKEVTLAFDYIIQNTTYLKELIINLIRIIDIYWYMREKEETFTGTKPTDLKAINAWIQKFRHNERLDFHQLIANFYETRRGGSEEIWKDPLPWEDVCPSCGWPIGSKESICPKCRMEIKRCVFCNKPIDIEAQEGVVIVTEKGEEREIIDHCTNCGRGFHLEHILNNLREHERCPNCGVKLELAKTRDDILASYNFQDQEDKMIEMENLLRELHKKFEKISQTVEERTIARETVDKFFQFEAHLKFISDKVTKIDTTTEEIKKEVRVVRGLLVKLDDQMLTRITEAHKDDSNWKKGARMVTEEACGKGLELMGETVSEGLGIKQILTKYIKDPTVALLKVIKDFFVEKMKSEVFNLKNWAKVIQFLFAIALPLII